MSFSLEGPTRTILLRSPYFAELLARYWHGALPADLVKVMLPQAKCYVECAALPRRVQH